jgi:hypothetical protein
MDGVTGNLEALAMLTSVGSHRAPPSVSSIVRQLSNSHLVGTRDSMNVVVPCILNGIKIPSQFIPNSRVLSVGSSGTVQPQCGIWFGLMRLIINFLPYQSTWLNCRIIVSPLVGLVYAVNAFTIGISVTGLYSVD